MKVLVIGGGGREHALAWKLANDSTRPEIFCAPGNAGMAEVGTNLDISATDVRALLEWAKKNRPDLTVVGPEAPLVAIGAGIVIVALHRTRIAAQPQAITLLAVAGSAAAISTIFGNPVVGAVLMLEVVGFAGSQVLLVMLPAVLASGVGALVFTGEAGGLGDGVKVGDLVLADTLLQHDMDASPLFPRFEVPLTGRSRFPADAALTQALATACEAVLALPQPFGPTAEALGVSRPALHRGLIVSGDRFVGAASECAALRQALPDALAVEMEGAALAQACHDLGLPFAVLRSISDRADDSAHVDFMRFIDEVASRASAAIVDGWLSAR